MESFDNQTEYWDKVATLKNFTHPLEMKKLAAYLSKDALILDYGCGYGRLCHALTNNGYKNVIGVDSSNAMIVRGLSEHPHLDLRSIDNDLPVTERYDAIILFAVLTCIPSDEAQITLITQLYQRLKPKGILYISDYWLQNNDRNLKRYREFFGKHGEYGIFELPDGAIVRHHSKGWIESLVGNFETKEFYDCELPSMNGNLSSCFQFIGRKI